MSALSTRLTALQEQLQDVLAGMSQRDRTLLMGLIIAAIIGVVGGSIYTMRNRLTTLEKQIQENQNNLQLVEIYVAEYEASKEQAEAIERELSQSSGTALSAFLEQKADRVSIGDKLDAVKEKSASNNGTVEEKVYAVSLSELTEQELAEFLYEIESGGFPLKIQSMKVRTRTRKGEKTLRVDMDISAFKPIKGGEG